MLLDSAARTGAGTGVWQFAAEEESSAVLWNRVRSGWVRRRANRAVVEEVVHPELPEQVLVEDAHWALDGSEVPLWEYWICR